MKKTVGFAFIIASLAMAYSGEQIPAPSKEMNGLVRSIHAELLKLKASIPWLSEYNDSSLSEDHGRSSIRYSPREKEEKDPNASAPQQSDHFSLSYLNIDQPKQFKYSNVFEDEPVCRFPELHLKLYGEVLIWKDRALEKRLKDLVIAKCQERQKTNRSRKRP